jgi:HPt (histidine-containing phosphotransfer) domain-containing protein
MSQAPTADTSSDEPLDRDRWAKLLALQVAVGRSDFLKELAAIFLRDAPLRLTSIREGLDAGDASKASQAAHSLKGSSGNVGAKFVTDIAGNIERCANEGALDEAKGLYSRLESEVDRACQALIDKSGAEPAAP